MAPRMGILTSWKRRRAERLANARSDKIDLQIREDSILFRRQVNVLLISIPESEAAAFAFVGHMKIMHYDGYSHEELSKFRQIIWKALLENSRNVVQTLQSNTEHVDHAVKFAQVVQDLWADETIPELLDQLSLDDNAEYFFAAAKRIATEDYIPCAGDILRAPVRKGLTETYFTMDQTSIRVCHICGQRDKKFWKYLSERVTTILFYASLSDYNKLVTTGIGQETRLAKSLVLFQDVTDSHWFSRSSIVLFLSEIREFRTKLPEVPLANYFPEYTGGPDVNKGSKFILGLFAQANRGRLTVFTDTSDTSNLRMFFSAVSETFLQNALRDAELL
ncbi:G-protein alpha subunit-domain-containing protein [Russula compacta]|nr:G-protein alpha subunit-domain-containing protein [Russula compacta]